MRIKHNNDDVEPRRFQQFLFSASLGIVLGVLLTQVMNQISGVNAIDASVLYPNPKLSTDNQHQSIVEDGSSYEPTPSSTKVESWSCYRPSDPVDVVEMKRVELANKGGTFEVPFYMDDNPKFGTTALLQCVIHVAGMESSCRTGDSLCTIDVARILGSRNIDSTFHELVGDLLLLEHFRHHKWRTNDPAKAKLFIIDFAPSVLAKFPKNLADWGCENTLPKGVTSRHDFEKQLVASLSSSQFFKKNLGKDHLLLFTPPISGTTTNKRISTPLRDLLSAGPVVVATLDTSWPKQTDGSEAIDVPNGRRILKRKKGKIAKGESSKPNLLAMRSIVIPGVPIGTVLEWAEENQKRDLLGTFRARRHSLFAYPVLEAIGENRVDPIAMLAGKVKGMAFPGMRGSNGLGKRTRIMSEDQMVMQLVTNSKFCLVVNENDNFSQVYTFLAAGCIPIVLSSFPSMSLPFPSLIDWDSVVFNGQGMSCVEANMSSTASMIQNLLDWSQDVQNDAQVLKMLQAGADAYTALRYINVIPNYAKESVAQKDIRQVLQPHMTQLADNVLRQVVLERLV